MTTVEIVGAISAVFSSGLIGGVLGKAVDWKKASNDRAKIDSDADAAAKAVVVAEMVEKSRRETVLVDGMGKLITTLQTTLDARTKDADAARAATDEAREAHGECMEEVRRATTMASEAVERVTVVEVQQAETVEQLKACEERDKTSQARHVAAAKERDEAAAQVRDLRVKVALLDKRTSTSGDKTPAQR